MRWAVLLDQIGSLRRKFDPGVSTADVRGKDEALWEASVAKTVGQVAMKSQNVMSMNMDRHMAALLQKKERAKEKTRYGEGKHAHRQVTNPKYARSCSSPH